MVGMVARLRIVLSCLSLALLGAGCNSGGQFSKCVPGASAACACPTGQQGAQTCNSAGTFAACVCAAPGLDAGGPGGAGGTTTPLASGGTGGQGTALADAGIVADAQPEALAAVVDTRTPTSSPDAQPPADSGPDASSPLPSGFQPGICGSLDVLPGSPNGHCASGAYWPGTTIRCSICVDSKTLQSVNPAQPCLTYDGTSGFPYSSIGGNGGNVICLPPPSVGGPQPCDIYCPTLAADAGIIQHDTATATPDARGPETGDAVNSDAPTAQDSVAETASNIPAVCGGVWGMVQAPPYWGGGTLEHGSCGAYWPGTKESGRPYECVFGCVSLPGNIVLPADRVCVSVSENFQTNTVANVVCVPDLSSCQTYCRPGSSTP
jgi:hypothetical protein